MGGVSGIVPALADLSFPRSATPWQTALTLTEDGDALDTTGYSARFDVASDATFSAVYFSVSTAGFSPNGSTLTLDDAGDIELLISQNDANLIPTNGVQTVAAPYRLLLTQVGATEPVVTGTLYAEPF